MSFLDKNKK